MMIYIKIIQFFNRYFINRYQVLSCQLFYKIDRFAAGIALQIDPFDMLSGFNSFNNGFPADYKRFFFGAMLLLSEGPHFIKLVIKRQTVQKYYGLVKSSELNEETGN